QLRATVNEGGLHGEPTKQVLEYIWSGSMLCPSDIRAITRLILPRSRLANIGGKLWQPATAGSLGLDLATAVECILLNKQPVAIDSDLKGPLIIDGTKMGAQLIGRSSATMNGITVYPGVIDADYTGTIKIMVKAEPPPITIPKGSKIAQLIPIPQVVKGQDRMKGSNGFGSTGGLVMFSIPLGQRPSTVVSFTRGEQQFQVSALLDTGADVTIVNMKRWSSHWPLQQLGGSVQGAGGIVIS
ncbi:POK9 protein, partial [Bucco capensis]|nr:POK9 protein [Bucco capensis]